MKKNLTSYVKIMSILVSYCSKYKNKLKLLSNLVLDQTKIIQERASLFGDKDPDKEEACLTALIEENEKQLETARQFFNSAEQVCVKLKSNIESLEKTVADRFVQL